ncbi:hypothetical protein LUZ60_009608 [Juncus effusus]|nr:hypothetical protein LUZ60_009608 [Juncus effusus]
MNKKMAGENSKAANPRSNDRWVEVHLYRRGKGPTTIFRSGLVGPGSDRLDVRSILTKYGLRSLFAFKPPAGRGFKIRFDQSSGWSTLPYKAGSVVCFDSEVKGSLIKPMAIILIGVTVPVIAVLVLMKELPYQYQIRPKSLVGSLFPPWLLAFGVIIYTRMRRQPRVAISRSI